MIAPRRALDSDTALILNCALVLPRAQVSGTRPMRFSVSPGLFEGLSFDPLTGAIAGTVSCRSRGGEPVAFELAAENDYGRATCMFVALAEEEAGSESARLAGDGGPGHVEKKAGDGDGGSEHAAATTEGMDSTKSTEVGNEVRRLDGAEGGDGPCVVEEALLAECGDHDGGGMGGGGGGETIPKVCDGEGFSAVGVVGSSEGEDDLKPLAEAVDVKNSGGSRDRFGTDAGGDEEEAKCGGCDSNDGERVEASGEDGERVEASGKNEELLPGMVDAEVAQERSSDGEWEEESSGEGDR